MFRDGYLDLGSHTLMMLYGGFVGEGQMHVPE